MKEEALKLADEADFISTTIEALEWVRNANLMIRKLVAELDKQDEPVAWIYKRNDGVKFLNWKTWKDCETCNGEFIPLYTAPQIKEFTQSELKEILMKNTEYDYVDYFSLALDMNEAILKKASEK